jgi:ribosomal protein L34E
MYRISKNRLLQKTPGGVPETSYENYERGAALCKQCANADASQTLIELRSSLNQRLILKA